MNLTKKEITVTGMHCTGCADRVTGVLNDLEGVRSAEVSLDHGQAVVSYDAEQTGFIQMKKAIEKAGYQVERQ